MLEGQAVIVASHQPNFLPYPGYFYKMYLCDAFTYSDTVQFSKSAFHNYNYIVEEGMLCKLTVPVHKAHSICDILLHDWDIHSVKIIKRLIQDYSKAKFFKSIFPLFEDIFKRGHKTLCELNIALNNAIMNQMQFNCFVINEGKLFISGDNASQQIVSICKSLKGDTYLSGNGALDYIDKSEFDRNGIDLLFTNYKPLSYGSLPNASMFDYLMHCGFVIPDEWKQGKERLKSGLKL